MSDDDPKDDKRLNSGIDDPEAIDEKDEKRLRPSQFSSVVVR